MQALCLIPSTENRKSFGHLVVLLRNVSHRLKYLNMVPSWWYCLGRWSSLAGTLVEGYENLYLLPTSSVLWFLYVNAGMSSELPTYSYCQASCLIPCLPTTVVSLPFGTVSPNKPSIGFFWSWHFLRATEK